MREAWGLVGLDAGFVVVGEAALLALGRVRSTRAAIVNVGLALMIGWTLTGSVLAIALAASAAGTVPEIVVGWALATGILVAVATRTPTAEAPPRAERRVGRWPALLAAAFAGAYLVEVFRAVRDTQTLEPDAWNFWLPKAMTLVWFGGIDTGPGGFTSYTNADYPPLVQGLEATSFRFLGRVDAISLPAEHWVVVVAFWLAVAALLAPRVRPAILWPALAVAAILPGFVDLIGSSLADEPLTMLFALAGLCAALWLVDRDPRNLVLLAVFLVALPLAKNEGLMLDVVLLVALFAAGLRQATWTQLVPLAAAPVVGTLPWRIWLSANHIRGNPAYHFSDLFRFGYLGDRAGRLGIGLHALVDQVFSTSRWLLAAPLALALAAVLATRRTALAAFVVGACALAFVGYAVIYWISPFEIHYYVDSSAARVVVPIVVLAAVASPLLLQEAVE